jgi:hypothetical protein
MTYRNLISCLGIDLIFEGGSLGGFAGITPEAFRMCRIVASEIEDGLPCSGLTIALAT